MATALVDRLPTSRRAAILAIGDLTAIAVFVAAGEVSHARPVLSGVGTFLAFVAGWIVAASIVGAYEDRALASVGRAAVVAAATSLAAVLLGQVLRAAVVSGASLTPAFVIVSLVVVGGLLVVWRSLAAHVLHAK